MSKRLICICNFVDEREITDLLKRGANSTEDIQNLSRAGTSCGRCLPEIDDLVTNHKKEEPKDQQRLNFGF